MYPCYQEAIAPFEINYLDILDFCQIVGWEDQYSSHTCVLSIDLWPEYQ